jgi:hypothetical protein
LTWYNRIYSILPVVIPEIVKHKPHGMLLQRLESGLISSPMQAGNFWFNPSQRVIGSGTIHDTAPSAHALSHHFGF